MSHIRVVWGTASAPTPMASFDAALREANIHNYNLVTVSSVIPDDVAVEAVGTAPDLGPVGNRLTVVEGKATVAPASGDTAVAALAWAQTPSGKGIFYEASGHDPADVRTRVEEGLEAGKAIRNWEFGETNVQLASAPADSTEYVTALVVAAYGESEPII
ncbi:pyruvoyl-dependent arginine decarboxylase [Haladaptatus sp. CMSO5]|uniref:pyruvoyl-dependent arginine decarboxylase n=1 Tax=Haladaptatus sp. CMSO5 TaxID=3120514 RepID=UPI002FCE463B